MLLAGTGALAGALAGAGCSMADQELTSLVVSVPGRSMSKLPFVIAADQGLYREYGLDVELRLSPPEFEDGIEPQPRFLDRVLRKLGAHEPPPADITVNGLTPTMVRNMRQVPASESVAIASTDCSVRYYVIGRPGVESLEDLKGGRLGVGFDGTTTGFTTLRLIERMGWSPLEDISIVTPAEAGAETSLLRDGVLDAIVGGDGDFEAAQLEGFPILADTRSWNEEVAGNSVLVDPEWWSVAENRDAARRFLQALIAATARFHEDRELVLDVLERWHGMPGPIAEGRYQRADYVRRKPYPCVEGIRNTMKLYDSYAMRQHTPEDFYDDSLVRELDKSGFIDSLYH